MSPTARSLAWLRDNGWRGQVVERWLPYTQRRTDLFGFIDIIAISSLGGSITGIQVTTTSNMAARLSKIRLECADAAVDWLRAGGTIHLHGWSKKGARGKRKTWTLTGRAVTLADLDSESTIQ